MHPRSTNCFHVHAVSGSKVCVRLKNKMVNKVNGAWVCMWVCTQGEQSLLWTLSLISCRSSRSPEVTYRCQTGASKLKAKADICSTSSNTNSGNPPNGLSGNLGVTCSESVALTRIWRSFVDLVKDNSCIISDFFYSDHMSWFFLFWKK